MVFEHTKIRAFGDAVRQRLTPKAWVCCLAIVSAALGGFMLADKGLWLDEVASLSFALGGPKEWFADHNMALFYAISALVIDACGMSELALRAPSALAFCVSCCAFYGLARALDSERVARTASVMFVLNATLVHFAQEARGYMLAVMFLVVAAWALVLLVQRSGYRYALLLGVCLGLSMYAHLFAALVALAHALTLLSFALQRAVPKRLVVTALGVALVLALPMLWIALEAGPTQISWLLPPDLRNTWASWCMWLGGGAALGWLGLMLSVATLARWYGRSRQRLSTLRSISLANRLIVGWCSIPVVVSYGVGLLVSPVVHPKYLLVIVPALMLFMARAIEAQQQRWLRVLSLAVWCVLSVGRLHFWYADYDKEQWREALVYLAEHGGPRDLVVLAMPYPDALDYYATRLSLVGRLPRIWPERAWGFPPTKAGVARRAALDAAPRVWLVENRGGDSVLTDRLEAQHLRTLQLSLEPTDEDGASLFADSRGRVIELSLYELRQTY